MNLTRLWHWQRFVPHIGDNLELTADQLTLELAVGLTKVELAGFHRAQFDARNTDEREVVKVLLAEARAQLETEFPMEAQKELRTRVDAAVAAMDAAYVARLAIAWAPFVRLGPGSHSLNGKPLANLADYLGFINSQAGRYNLLELVEELQRLNSVEGTRALFSDAAAGGNTSTRPPSTAPSGNQTAGR